MKGIKNKIIVSTFMIGLSITSANCMIFGCGAMYSKEGTHNSSGVHTVSTKAETKGEKVEVAKDPVCNMDVTDTKKAPSEEYKGKVYYFCSGHCKNAFKKDPASYIK
ncbi:MAG: hypothetical protein A3J73_01355 [Planctomycetes bacterium RIFCSPHIGHO2_02_FULL_38_41]|nr:MAG: hypothetical protein A3J73_01355 [Planctomycetes bacterium RIFCSPHIGHO2_02_FULL_38_41]OHB98065.1 MAG: hypothetical protein A2W74_05950 [Planctomycetes bacterium RIFCSPLOWO2_12_38_17]